MLFKHRLDTFQSRLAVSGYITFKYFILCKILIFQANAKKLLNIAVPCWNQIEMNKVFFSKKNQRIFISIKNNNNNNNKV